MIYAYCCPHCENGWDVVKPAAQYDSPEQCPKCSNEGKRNFLPQKIHLYGTSVQEREYNPGLGCVVNGKAHVKEICRQRGLEEVGNEKPEKLHKHFDKRREEKWEQGWESADKGWVGEG